MSDKEGLLVFIPDSDALVLNDTPCFLDDDPTDWFILGFECDSCNGKGCSACTYSGLIEIYFNSEPNEPNIIGINERMVND